MVQTIQREFRGGGVKTAAELAKSIGSRATPQCRFALQDALARAAFESRHFERLWIDVLAALLAPNFQGAVMRMVSPSRSASHLGASKKLS